MVKLVIIGAVIYFVVMPLLAVSMVASLGAGGNPEDGMGPDSGN
jgi:predicted Na+-dependent transporter